MSVDRSLRLKSSLARHRNVLSRAERINKLTDQERWDDSMSPLGLPKIANRKAKASKKKAKEEAATTEQAPTAASPAAAPAAPAAKPASK